MVQIKQQELRAYFAARAGISDALYELKVGESWDVSNDDLNEQWHHKNESTFYKSSVLETVIPKFSYPATMTVSVSGNVLTEELTITSVGASGFGTPEKTTAKTIETRVVRSLFGQLHVVSERGL